MQVKIQNKWISLRGSSVVKDVEDNVILNVKGKFFTFTQKKYIQDLNGTTKYVVRNKFWSFFVYQAFIMTPDEKEILSHIKRKFFSLHDDYRLNSPYGEIVFRGNILGFDYHIILNGEEVGHVARKISLRDSFFMDLKEGLDLEYFVALVIAMDNISDRRQGSHSGVTISNSGN